MSSRELTDEQWIALAERREAEEEQRGIDDEVRRTIWQALAPPPADRGS